MHGLLGRGSTGTVGQCCRCILLKAQGAYNGRLSTVSLACYSLFSVVRSQNQAASKHSEKYPEMRVVGLGLRGAWSLDGDLGVGDHPGGRQEPPVEEPL